MKRTDLRKYLLPEDKMMVAVKWEVDESYIDKILRGDRDVRSERAQGIVADLEALAQENILWMGHKRQLIAA